MITPVSESVCGPEESLGVEALAYLRKRGWKCFAETELVWGAPTDIVAIRQRRVLIIELKPFARAELWAQMKEKYTRWPGYGKLGVQVIGLVSKCNTPTGDNPGPSWWLHALEDGQLYRWQTDHIGGGKTDSWWIPVTDIAEARRKDDWSNWQAERLRPLAMREPADKRLMAFFSQMVESDRAGSPTGSKNHSLLSLCLAWAAAYPEKLKHLTAKEAAHLVGFYLPACPVSYAEEMVRAAQNPPEAHNLFATATMPGAHHNESNDEGDGHE